MMSSSISPRRSAHRLSTFPSGEMPTKRTDRADVEVGFLDDGRLHVFSTVEDAEGEESETSRSGSGVVEYLETHREDVTKKLPTECSYGPLRVTVRRASSDSSFGRISSRSWDLLKSRWWG